MCPPNSKEIEGKCYQYFSTRTSQADASTACQTSGGFLFESPAIKELMRDLAFRLRYAFSNEFDDHGNEIYI